MEPEIKLPTFVGSWRKQGSSRKTSTFASLTTFKHVAVWITTNCGKFLEMGVSDHLTCLLRNLYASQEATYTYNCIQLTYTCKSIINKQFNFWYNLSSSDLTRGLVYHDFCLDSLFSRWSTTFRDSLSVCLWVGNWNSSPMSEMSSSWLHPRC